MLKRFEAYANDEEVRLYAIPFIYGGEDDGIDAEPVCLAREVDEVFKAMRGHVHQAVESFSESRDASALSGALLEISRLLDSVGYGTVAP